MSRYLVMLVVAFSLGCFTEAFAAGFDGGNAPGGGEVKGKWYNPNQGGSQSCCTDDADIKAIELGLDSADQDINQAADDALLKKLRGQNNR